MIETDVSRDQCCFSRSARRHDINGWSLSRDLEELGHAELEAATALLPVEILIPARAEFVDREVDGGVLVCKASTDLSEEVGSRGDEHGQVVCHLIESDQEFVVAAFIELLHRLEVHDLQLGRKLADLKLCSIVGFEVKHIKNK